MPWRRWIRRCKSRHLGVAFGRDLPKFPGELATSMKVILLNLVSAGLAVKNLGNRREVVIPEQYKVDHEAHFGQVTALFLGYLQGQPTVTPTSSAAFHR